MTHTSDSRRMPAWWSVTMLAGCSLPSQNLRGDLRAHDSCRRSGLRIAALERACALDPRLQEPRDGAGHLPWGWLGAGLWRLPA